MGDYDGLRNQSSLARVIKSLSPYQINPSQLKTEGNSLIGIGGYAEVHRAALTAHDVEARRVAVKELLPKQIKPLRLALRFAREVHIWSKLDHPNVLPFLGFYIDQNLSKFLFVSPLLEGGSLRCRLQSESSDGAQRWLWVKGVTSGLRYLHTLKPAVAHGDLKAANVLLGHRDEVVLCDFGLSSVMEDGIEGGLMTSEGFKGSIRWCSPELLNGQPRNTLSDIWAYGALVLEIMTGRVPFHRDKSEVLVLRRILDNKCPSPDEYPELPGDSFLWSLLEKCWRVNPSERIGIRRCWEIVNELHPRIKSLRATQICNNWDRHAKIICSAVSASGKRIAVIQAGDQPDVDVLRIWSVDELHENGIPAGSSPLRSYSSGSGMRAPSTMVFNDASTLLVVLHRGLLTAWPASGDSDDIHHFHNILSEWLCFRTVTLLFIGSSLILTASPHDTDHWANESSDTPIVEMWTNLEPGSPAPIVKRSEKTPYFAVEKLSISPDRTHLIIQRHLPGTFWLQAYNISTAEQLFQMLTTSGLPYTVYCEFPSLPLPDMPLPRQHWFCLYRRVVVREAPHPRRLVATSTLQGRTGSATILILGDQDWKFIGCSEEWLSLEVPLSGELKRRHFFHLPTLFKPNVVPASLDGSESAPHFRVDYNGRESDVFFQAAGVRVLSDQ